MNQSLAIIKKEIIRVLSKLSKPAWHSTNLVFAFPPYHNKGWTGSQLFKDIDENKIRLSLFGDDQFDKALYSFIKKQKERGAENQIVFIGERNNLDAAEIRFEYNQEIEDNFQNNLPKSQRGKTLPWWKNPEETEGLI